MSETDGMAKALSQEVLGVARDWIARRPYDCVAVSQRVQRGDEVVELRIEVTPARPAWAGVARSGEAAS